ncbi:MAG: 5-(carboxyamino)imidazole ribonucleotide mutase [Synergistaceae bacterium]|jgi:5-(carboxyamino)imidazole ribonucleotide mutase|nr:5-(carboxyamino)imidazole ribonucleotide mutase [Synergistaceae bacterium]
MSAVIGIVVGSASDLGVASKAADLLKEFGVPFEIGIASAHRTPEDVVRYASGAAERGILAIIAMAGLSAALPGVIAAHTTLPVIGVPIASGPLSGFDALTAIAQMPPGVPVACMSIDGARNAALMALRIAAIRDESLSLKLEEWTKTSADSVRQSREKIAESEGMKRIPDQAFSGNAPR